VLQVREFVGMVSDVSDWKGKGEFGRIILDKRDGYQRNKLAIITRVRD